MFLSALGISTEVHPARPVRYAKLSLGVLSTTGAIQSFRVKLVVNIFNRKLTCCDRILAVVISKYDSNSFRRLGPHGSAGVTKRKKLFVVESIKLVSHTVRLLIAAGMSVQDCQIPFSSA